MKARLAPTPSGYLHYGNAVNFALNSLLANGDELLLRIDDLDRSRFREVYVEDIFRVITWLGIKVTEGPSSTRDFLDSWSQRHRMWLYQEALALLRSQSVVFACPCTRKELASGQHRHHCKTTRIDLDTPNVAWRIDTEALPALVSVPDLVSKAVFEVRVATSIPDFVVRKKDGSPSYQLACTVDDVHFGVSHVGRGQDLLASTAAQSILSDLLGYTPLFTRIDFVHHPLIPSADGGKLSKSAGAKGVSALLDETSPAEVFAQAKSWLTGSSH